MSESSEYLESQDLLSQNSQLYTVEELMTACEENGTALDPVAQKVLQGLEERRRDDYIFESQNNSQMESNSNAHSMEHKTDSVTENTTNFTPNGTQLSLEDITFMPLYKLIVDGECDADVSSIGRVQDKVLEPVSTALNQLTNCEDLEYQDPEASGKADISENVQPGLEHQSQQCEPTPVLTPCSSRAPKSSKAKKNRDINLIRQQRIVFSEVNEMPSLNVVEVNCSEDSPTTRRRKKGRRPSLHVPTISAKQRMSGDQYKVAKYSTDSTGKKIATKITRASKKMGPPCSSSYCIKSSLRNCNKFSQKDREAIFTDFWKKLDWAGKKAMVKSLVDKPNLKANVAGKRQKCWRFHLKLNESNTQVCKKMFLGTLGLGRGSLAYWLNSKDGDLKQRRGPKPKPQVANAGTFLDNLPKLPSHYCRQSSSKMYLEPDFSSKHQLYKAYEQYSEICNFKPLSRNKFLQIVHEMNIGIFKPRKDRCDTCISFEAGNIGEDEYEKHLLMKELARRELESDRKELGGGNIHLISMDLQAVQVAPLLNASSLYFKTKLLVHNFTIFNMKDASAKCYRWDETEGDLSASTFCTCLLDFIKEYFPDKLPIVIYSDGCTAQNRNCILSNALLNCASQDDRIIIQKYLEKGHTQMEVDSVHSTIERRLKGKKINVPMDYAKICMEARQNPAPYNVKYMKHEDFSNFANSADFCYTSIRPGDLHVTNIRQLRYNPDRILEYKTDHSDVWTKMPGRKQGILCTQPSRLFSSRRPISVKKYNDLQELLHVIPLDYHDFYNTLPTT